MNKYNFNYSMSIHNAIYYLLGQKKELKGSNVDPLLWPGIYGILKRKNEYQLDTIFGTIKVNKASELFKNSSSSYIFRKKLMSKCYNRSYDFIKENSDKYKVVLSYMPNFFDGGHYHAYLESSSSILDIAANSFYFNKNDAKEIFCGEIIKKMTYQEIEEDYLKIKNEIPKLRNLTENKLQVLTLYYDYKNMKQ